jgi:hypothetical protein
MVASKNETERSMIRKGFIYAKGGSHHIWFEYWVDGNRVARTFISHGGDQDLDDYLLGEMGKRCHLTTQQFYRFAKCKMTEKEYRQILIDKGIIKE